jgi:hypothetical protein
MKLDGVGLLGRLFFFFIYSGPKFIAAVDITLALWKVTVSCIDLLTLLIH